jgi:integrase/recombinase XerD
MLEQYFVKPQTIDRVRASWIGPEIESYVSWMAEQRSGVKTIWHRVPIVVAFGEFARDRAAVALAELPAHVESFVAERVARHDARPGSVRLLPPKEIRGQVEQMLWVVLPGFQPSGRREHLRPFADVAPGFFEYLVEERGLRPVGDHRNSRSTIIECRVWRSSVLAFCDHRKSRLAG